MKTEEEDRAELRKLVKGINVSRDVMELVKRVEESDITKILNVIDGNFRENKSIELIFLNDGKTQDTRFNLVAVLDGYLMGELYTALLRRRHPAGKVRILTLYEGKFSNYVQYDSVNEVENAS